MAPRASPSARLAKPRAKEHALLSDAPLYRGVERGKGKRPLIVEQGDELRT
jgi:hypothetical protein